MEQISFLTPAVYQTSPDNRQVSKLFGIETLMSIMAKSL
ncbi:hypothetical protein MC7420_3435 [Coleofasciculus chthonoplastes PCC 7420]|uniref:Uncharacterized protein n=1 Tax=Coleofasciculus chthonoplastes PCC 7420 TaxID=118168 RepID=B4W3A9_9CYAN|nr:hypothetical protein MC7420_3435 [Coleofasciculus chthonoplastes PCC 7420]